MKVSNQILLIVTFLFYVAFSLTLPAHASRGDSAADYRRCLNYCIENDEVRLNDDKSKEINSEDEFNHSPSHDVKNDPYLVMLRWRVDDECKYRCMHKIESERKRIIERDGNGKYRPEQYYGKWPFKRLMGMQEPLSVLFSILNFVPHAMHLLIKRNREAYAPSNDPLRWIFLAASIIGCMTWIFSAVFHARDNYITERLDYHGVLLLMVSHFWIALVRLTCEIRWNTNSIKVSKIDNFTVQLSVLWGIILIGWSIRHIYWLNTVLFDYGYNMKAMVTVFVLQLIAWIIWVYIVMRQSKSNQKPNGNQSIQKDLSYKILLFQGILIIAASFEFLDIPPIGGYLDSHSIWHFLTIFIGFLWYDFLRLDATYRNHHPALLNRYND